MRLKKYLALGLSLSMALSVIAGCSSGAANGDQVVIYSNADE